MVVCISMGTGAERRSKSVCCVDTSALGVRTADLTNPMTSTPPMRIVSGTIHVRSGCLVVVCLYRWANLIHIKWKSYFHNSPQYVASCPLRYPCLAMRVIIRQDGTPDRRSFLPYTHQDFLTFSHGQHFRRIFVIYRSKCA